MLLYLPELREEYVADVDSATPCRVVDREEQNSSREVCKMEKITGRSRSRRRYCSESSGFFFLLQEGDYKFQTNDQNRSMLELSLVSYMSLTSVVGRRLNL